MTHAATGLNKAARLALGSTENLYFAIQYVRRGRSRFPRGIDLHFTGWPRSGNSYGVRLIEYAMPGLEMVHHLHQVASIKRALSRQIPTVVTVRKPADAIASYALKNLERGWDTGFSIDFGFDYYIRYHRFCVERASQLHFVGFQTIVGDPHRFLTAIAQVLDTRLGMNPKQVNDEVVERIQADMRAGATHDRLSENLANPEKERVKRELRQVIDADPRLLEAERLYGQLAERAA